MIDSQDARKMRFQRPQFSIHDMLLAVFMFLFLLSLFVVGETAAVGKASILSLISCVGPTIFACFGYVLNGKKGAVVAFMIGAVLAGVVFGDVVLSPREPEKGKGRKSCHGGKCELSWSAYG